MANNGFLPRLGQNITIATHRKAVVGAYNYAQQHSMMHDVVEYDGSLSRNDFYFGDNLRFYPEIWATVVDGLGLYSIGEDKEDRYVTVEVAAKARPNRVAEAMRVDPEFDVSANTFSGRPSTMALWLNTMCHYQVGAAPKAWVRSFFNGLSSFQSSRD
ncbi:hypothetical protein BJX99DRAFT_253985 [Aspergillus californicus]